MYTASTILNSVSVIGSIVSTADDGLDQTVDSGVTVHLDGRGGTDPRNETLTYQWTRTNGPGVTLSNSTAVNPIFTAPWTIFQHTFAFELVVTNDQGLVSKPDTVTITVGLI